LENLGLKPQSRTCSPHHQAEQKSINLRPQDSISMYKPSRKQPKSSRRGGTNVDPGESYWTNGCTELDDDQVTHWTYVTGEGVPPEDLDNQTVYPHGEEVADTVLSWLSGCENEADAGSASDMAAMQKHLITAQDLKSRRRAAEIAKQMEEHANLATTTLKLKIAEEQLRSLQATLVAERMSRYQIEREKDGNAEDVRKISYELASAVRALRHAKDEGRKTNEERRRLNRAFEETKNQ
jgi:hypothetical protein